ncbi:MAG TPA: NAD(P)-dependent oxidoreductase [Bryobacteraceae bacterium]|nr:NAD(P)-dependent oxidoreductase [Bryobacteraceae bacterium]
MAEVFITGGTGYMGRRLIPRLLTRGHKVTAVAREGSESRLPPGCEVIVADALDRTTWRKHLRPEHTLVHLVGVAHPSPSKTLEFVDIDLRSAREAILAAQGEHVRHFVYVSVAQPAPAMKSYAMVRAACESAIREAGLNATILRPWYVLGPGHWWPLALVPFYKIAEVIPGLAEGAKRLGLVKIDEMLAALMRAVENPPEGIRIVDVPAIRAAARL